MKELIERCKAGIYLTINPHKDEYKTVEQYCKSYYDSEFITFRETEDYKKSIELDTIIKLQFYPRTPVGSYTIVGYDLDDVIKQGIDMLNRNE